MIELTPPPGIAPFKSFVLHSGLTLFPDFDKGGKVRVDDEADAQELEQEGWKRTAASRHSKAVETDLLRKSMSTRFMRETGVMPPISNTSRLPSDDELLRRGLDAQTKRLPHSIGGADAHARTEFGSVATIEHGALMIAIDVGDGSMNIHGTNILLSEIDRDLREAAVSTASSFAVTFSAEEQRTQVAIIGLLVSEMLRRDSKLSERVKQMKQRERYD